MVVILKDNSNDFNKCLNYIIECNKYISVDINNLKDDKNFWIISLKDIDFNQNEIPKESKKDSDFENLIRTFLNLEHLKNKIKLNMISNYKKNKKKQYFLINYDALINNINIKKLEEIFKTKNELQNIIDDVNIKTSKKTKKIIPQFDENLKKAINECKKESCNFNNINNIGVDFIKKGTNKIQFFKNFLILSKNSIKLFHISIINKYYCLLGDERVILINLDTIEIYKYNDKDDKLNIEAFLNIK